MPDNTITNIATLSFSHDSRPFSVTATESILVKPVPTTKITMTKVADAAVYYVGDVVTYTIAITTNGLSPVSNSKIVDPIPTGLSFIAGSVTINGVSQPSLTPGNIPVTLPASGTVTVVYKCTIL